MLRIVYIADHESKICEFHHGANVREIVHCQQCNWRNVKSKLLSQQCVTLLQRLYETLHLTPSSDRL